MELILNMVGVLVGLATLCGGVFAYVKGLGKRDQQLRDLRGDFDKLEVRVTKAEESSQQISKLAAAVEHLAEKVTFEVQRLGDIWSLNHAHTREQMADFKDQLNRKMGE